MSRKARVSILIGPSAACLLASAAPSVSNEHQLRFRLVPPRQWLPFAHMSLLQPVGGRLPFARMVTTPDGEDAKFLKWLDAMAAEEFGGRGTTGASGTGSKRHENEWYADRCVFCTACSKAIDAEHGRRGVRCSGCRRWFHSHCRPKRAIQGSGDADHVDGSSSSSSSSKGRYFHSCECEAVYQALHRAAAEGQRQLAVGPRSRSGGIGGLMDNLFGGGRDAAGKGDAGEQLTFRLIDLADVKQQYKALQRNGTLHARQRRLLEQSGLAAAPAAIDNKQQQGPAAQQQPSKASSSESEAGADDGDDKAVRTTGSRAAKGGSSALDDFIMAAELLTRQWPGDKAKDVLEDSFGILLRRGGVPVCAATLNLYAPDHARIQAIVSAEGQQRRGHAAALVGELHELLAESGLRRVVAVIAEDTEEARAARDKMLKRRFSYQELPIETLVEWRQELPEYHKQLVGNCTLLVRPLQAAAGSKGR